MKLHEIAVAAGVRLAAYSVLNSTNAQALSLARGGERGPLWVTAERQTQGRGREGRGWVSEPGNLYASLLLAAPAPPQRWPQLSFVAALAAHDAISQTAAPAGSGVAIKWPNDLMLDGAKLGGILIEGESGANAPVAIGIGLNCVSHPRVSDYTTTDLAAAGMNVSAAVLFAQLSKSMVERLLQWNRGEGFPSVRADWLGRAIGIGERISVRAAGLRLSGEFESLDEEGRLLLRLPGGRISIISTGDVIMAPAPAPSSV
jgi:BirA family transcriptional regulator, biotin operon repressor / biotin---[acetyl-CoA-carboxylase] ligase